ncbi:hypothetical protein NXS98_07490 [Fontisphaera persica]|uniref:hypothetical protein n=1 Tax=Fontisphaera persica TaxID=2974023 RepID=UPI0024C020EA|nr:hypothetical protein [Fontisphaera persica]WCJ60953.1 hypothetical protein NXS98_07490 [Fontisphaera persica]
MAVVVHSGTNAGTYFPAYDGNGNVVGYVRAADGVWVAQYEYGPFGELLRATGPLSQAFPTSSPLNTTTGKPASITTATATTPHHRPVVEQGSDWRGRGQDLYGFVSNASNGVNLYAFVGNRPISHFDWLGLYDLQFDWLDKFTDAQKQKVKNLVDQAGAQAQRISDELKDLIPRIKALVFAVQT